MRIAYAALLPPKASRRFNRPPLFAGYLASYVARHRLDKDLHDIVNAPELRSLPTLRRVAARLLAVDPHIVALSVFVWNHKQVAKICRILRRLSPETTLVLGGPEVAFTPEQAFRDFDVDWVCTGEGEIPFLALVNKLEQQCHFSDSLPGLLHRRGSRTDRHRISPPVARLDDIPSPYLTGRLPLDTDGLFDLETTRGCPFRCRFCLYGKTFETLRQFSLDRIERDVRFAIARGATFLYLLDPTFNYPPNRCREICRLLQNLNPDRKLHIHAEIRAEIVDEQMADDFFAAGVRTVEIGLQSTSRETLKLMKRGLGTHTFVRGCELLLQRGISAEIGMIVGLPGDTKKSIRETARFVHESSLGELNVYRLQVLPGSEYHKMAQELELDYEPNPPYYIIRTATLRHEQIIRLVDRLKSLAVEQNAIYRKSAKRNRRQYREANMQTREYLAAVDGIRRDYPDDLAEMTESDKQGLQISSSVAPLNSSVSHMHQ